MRTFVDTNVLVYAHDVDAGEKRDLASSRLRQLWADRDGVLSTQVLQEVYVNVTRKIRTPVSRQDARDLLKAYAVWPLVVTDAADIQTAVGIEEQHRLGFWGALIVAPALKANAGVLLSEVLHATAKLRGIRVENPFTWTGASEQKHAPDAGKPGQD